MWYPGPYETRVRECLNTLDEFLVARFEFDDAYNHELFDLYNAVVRVCRDLDLEIRGVKSLLQDDILLSPFTPERLTRVGHDDDSDDVVPPTPQPASPIRMFASPITPTQRVYRNRGFVHVASPQTLHRVVSRAPITLEDVSPSQTQPVVITTQSQPTTRLLPTPLPPTHPHLLVHVSDKMEDSPPLVSRGAPRAPLVQSHQRRQPASRPAASPRALSFASLKRR